MRRAALLVLTTAALIPSPLRAQPETLDGPWATHDGDLSATASSAEIPYLFGDRPPREVWRLDLRSLGIDRAASRNPITFDSEGNLYWKTSLAGEPAGMPRVASASPAGQLRWSGRHDGEAHTLGDVIDGTAVVVGGAAVYAVGGTGGFVGGTMYVAAYDRADGELLWQTELPETIVGAVPGTLADLLTPILHDGKIYVIGPDAEATLFVGLPLPRRVHRIDAASGALDWSAYIEEVESPMQGAATFVAGAFGPGEHGIYFNGDSGGDDDVPDVFAIRVDEGGATLGWAAHGGPVARSRLLYSAATELLYAPTSSERGAELYVYDPATGFVTTGSNPDAAGHGFFDVAALDFDGTTLYAGSEEALVVAYDVAEGEPDEGRVVVAPEDGAWWGAYRVYGQLLRSPDDHLVLVTGTNSRSDLDAAYDARIVAIDLTGERILWEYRTGIIQDNGFTVRGGPLIGPDGKLYYFDTVDGALVALEASSLPQGVGPFLRGDCNQDGQALGAPTDGIYLLNFLFSSGPGPKCLAACDFDGNGEVFATPTDALFFFNFNFLGGPPLPEPRGACDFSSREEDVALGCDEPIGCADG